jgi:hypothetical protein
VPELLARPGARVIASTSPLSPAQDAELTRLQAQLRQQLTAAGRSELRAALDTSGVDVLAFAGVPGLDGHALVRAAALNKIVERRGVCRCAVVAVPSGG